MESLHVHVPVDDLVAIIQDYADPQRLWERHVIPALQTQDWDALRNNWAVYELTSHPSRLTDTISLGLLPLMKNILSHYATNAEERSSIDKSTFYVGRSLYRVVFSDITQESKDHKNTMYDVVPYLVQTVILGLHPRFDLFGPKHVPQNIIPYFHAQMQHTGLIWRTSATPMSGSHFLRAELVWRPFSK